VIERLRRYGFLVTLRSDDFRDYVRYHVHGADWNEAKSITLHPLMREPSAWMSCAVPRCVGRMQLMATTLPSRSSSTAGSRVLGRPVVPALQVHARTAPPALPAHRCLRLGRPPRFVLSAPVGGAGPPQGSALTSPARSDRIGARCHVSSAL
jgi:hypothetical protein